MIAYEKPGGLEGQQAAPRKSFLYPLSELGMRRSRSSFERNTMKTSDIILVLAAFLASAVEAVEALTVVLATGVTRGWRSTLIGAGAALLVLAALIAALGPALASVPIDMLRLLIGALLLIFGRQGLRKAMLRASGYIPLRDEAAIYQAQLAEGQGAQAKTASGMDWYAFTLAFKSVFLEGFEVAFIVLTFGTAQGNIPLAALGALLALAVVVLIGALLREPLSHVPENTIKFAVGMLLSAFGLFWSVEGLTVEWPGGDLAILGLLVYLTIISLGFVAALRSTQVRQAAKGPSSTPTGD